MKEPLNVVGTMNMPDFLRYDPLVHTEGDLNRLAINQDAISFVDRTMAVAYQFLPIEIDHEDKVLTVAVSKYWLDHPMTADDVHFVLEYSLEIVAVNTLGLALAINKYYGK